MTVTSGMVRMILKNNGFTIEKESINEHIENSAQQRSRYWFRTKHRSGIAMECWLRHNLEGHNDNPLNTHRLFVGCDSFRKYFDFRGKENGPTAKEFRKYIQGLDKALNHLIGLIEIR
jgi:hypothetical protein